MPKLTSAKTTAPTRRRKHAGNGRGAIHRSETSGSEWTDLRVFGIFNPTVIIVGDRIYIYISTGAIFSWPVTS